MAVMGFGMGAIGKLTLRNYRCFDWDNPVTLEFGDGFTATNHAAVSRQIFLWRRDYKSVNLFAHESAPWVACCYA